MIEKTDAQTSFVKHLSCFRSQVDTRMQSSTQLDNTHASKVRNDLPSIIIGMDVGHWAMVQQIMCYVIDIALSQLWAINRSCKGQCDGWFKKVANTFSTSNWP